MSSKPGAGHNAVGGSSRSKIAIRYGAMGGVIEEVFARSSVNCISSCRIFSVYSRESLCSFRQPSHIVEIVPTVDTRRVPAGISISPLHTEYPVGHGASKLANNETVSRAKVTEGKSANTQSAILSHRRMSLLRFTTRQLVLQKEISGNVLMTHR